MFDNLRAGVLELLRVALLSAYPCYEGVSNWARYALDRHAGLWKGFMKPLTIGAQFLDGIVLVGASIRTSRAETFKKPWMPPALIC